MAAPNAAPDSKVAMTATDGLLDDRGGLTCETASALSCELGLLRRWSRYVYSYVYVYVYIYAYLSRMLFGDLREERAAHLRRSGGGSRMDNERLKARLAPPGLSPSYNSG